MKFLVSLCAIMALCFACIPAALALDPDKSVRQYVHNAWQTDDGLPQNYVQAIIQTRDGYIWLATQEGLVRFDGISFTVFDKRNTPELRENNIQALYEDRTGAVWIGTEGGGLVRMRDRMFTAFTTEQGLADNIVDAIFEDRAGALWIGTLRGLNRFKDESFTLYTTADGLASNIVLAVYEDRAGALWVGTEGGLNKFEDGRFTTYKTKDGLANDLVRSIFEDRTGALWIATRSGLTRFKDGRFSSLTSRDKLASDSVRAAFEDSDGNIWIGTNGGLNRLTEGRITTYTTADGLTNENIAAIFEDREGSLWVGTYGGGLNRLKDGKFTVFTKESGLSSDFAQPVCQDRAGALWIGTAGGLNRLKDGKITSYTEKNGLVSDTVLSLCEDRTGALWIGTAGGLNRLQGGRLAAFTKRDGLSDDEVLSICEGRDGALWVGTASGLNRFDGKRFTAYSTEDGLTNNSIWAMSEDRAGALWIGTDGGGLNRFKDGKFISYTTKDGLASDIVLSIYQDRTDALWIGTGGGLSRLKEGHINSYTTADGLFDDVVFQILEDEKQNLWMSCNKGVFRVSRAELEEFADGKTNKITSLSYGTADGMKSRECNGGFQPAGWKTADGKLWFPTIKGVVMIDPADIRFNDQPPPVVVERVIIDSESISARDNLEIGPGKRRFEFHYTGLSFLAPEKVRFKYKLEGFDRDWIDAGARREATYNSLSPGYYKFRVIASNNDGVWSETGAAFDFYLKPYFYQTYWFYMICAALLGLACWGLYRLRVRQMQARFSAVLAERNRIAREIHDTLAQGFAGISVQLESVNETMIDSPGVAKNHLDKARTLVRTSLAEARRSVWDLRSTLLEEDDLAEALARIAQQLSAAGAAEVEVTGDRRRLSAAIENNLLHIGREALTNAVKHAYASRIRVEINFEKELVRVRVRDDGRGFDTLSSNGAGGFGLISMRERAEQIGANLSIESAPGEGTEVTVVARA